MSLVFVFGDHGMTEDGNNGGGTEEETNAGLLHASSRYKETISQKDTFDSLAYREACGLFKYFLLQATDLRKKVWTQFDTTGMGIGFILLILSLVLSIPVVMKASINSFAFRRRIKKVQSLKISPFLRGGI